jgi:hypothetical protein
MNHCPTPEPITGLFTGVDPTCDDGARSPGQRGTRASTHIPGRHAQP